MAKKITTTKKVSKTSNELKVVDATEPCPISITVKDIDTAVCGDPSKCVISAGLTRKFGKDFVAAEVGRTCTKVILTDKILRFSTPAKIRRQLPVFDETGMWDLGPGKYTLDLFVKAPNRFDKKRYSGGVKSMFKARAIPSRRVRSITNLKAA